MQRFSTKAEWADAKAKEFDDAAVKLDGEFVHYTKLAGKNESVAFMRSEASRFRRMASSYRRRGL